MEPNTWVYNESAGWIQWLRPDIDTVRGSIVLSGVHSQQACDGRPCVIHNPTDHHMRSWQLIWRKDRALFERICPTHGTGHPDPDQFDYWAGDLYWRAVHGCCGCCQALLT